MKEELFEILSTKRPARSREERRVVLTYVASLPGSCRDAYGNYTVRVGQKPRIAFSCHTDTVHDKGGKQRIIKGDVVSLARVSKSTCLGADDGAGLWLMRQMIICRVPGLYIFHRDEEHGCLGSRWIVENEPETVSGIEAMISFDRHGLNSIVTHQCNLRTASDAFAGSLSAEMARNGMPGYRADDTGGPSDSHEYTSLVPECTNISAGYRNHHTPEETQNIPHLFRLLRCMVGVDWSSVIIRTKEPARNP
jgi:hypothetical protein